MFRSYLLGAPPSRTYWSYLLGALPGRTYWAHTSCTSWALILLGRSCFTPSDTYRPSLIGYDLPTGLTCLWASPIFLELYMLLLLVYITFPASAYMLVLRICVATGLVHIPDARMLTGHVLQQA
jgi:hypothetical protein